MNGSPVFAELNVAIAHSGRMEEEKKNNNKLILITVIANKIKNQYNHGSWIQVAYSASCCLLIYFNANERVMQMVMNGAVHHLYRNSFAKKIGVKKIPCAAFIQWNDYYFSSFFPISLDNHIPFHQNKMVNILAHYVEPIILRYTHTLCSKKVSSFI